MSWIGGSSLTVEEEDGSPSIGGVTKIQISNATLTDDGGGQVSIAVTPGVLSSIEGVSPTSDVAPGTLLAEGGDAWPGATVNTTGANLILAGGIGRRIYTVVAYGHASMADSTATVTVNGAATVLTEGVDWTAATSNNATATSLAAAIDAVSGVSATASSAVVRIVPDTGTYGLTIAKSADNAGMTATSGTDGAVNIPDAIQLLFDDDVALFRVGDGALQVTDGTPTGYGAIRGYQWLGFDNDGDANASVDIFEGTISFGAGGANAVDTDIRYVTTRTLQLIGSGASTDKGNLWLGGLRGFATGGSVNMFEFINTGINLRATLPINWSSGENSDGPFDLGAVRAGVNLLKITNGSTGYGALSLDTNAGVYADTVTLSDAAKTAVLDIAIADGEFIGGTLTYTITATDATDHQALTGIVGFSGVRKNGTPDTYHLTIAESASPVLAESAGASTLTDTWEIDAGTNVATISVTADSSLTTPTMTCRYHLILNSANTVTKK